MLVGRLVGSSLSKISPRSQLTITTVCAALLTAAAIIIDDPWLLVGVGLFHSIMWGCIFTLAVDGLGEYTSAAWRVYDRCGGRGSLPLVPGRARRYARRMAHDMALSDSM